MIGPLALLLATTPLPDALDHLRAASITPNIGLLLDASCSMGQSPRIPTSCSWFATHYTSNNLSMTKNQVMRAALVGCQSSSDGILDRWTGRVNFSIFDFGRSSTDATLRAAFGSNLAALETAALSVPATGSTPITNALRAHGRYFGTYFSDSNTPQCRPNFILLLTDGDPNGGAASFDFNCPMTGDPAEVLPVSSTQPWYGSDYMTRHRDLLCRVSGEQQIRTYTLGFGAPGSYNPTNLQNIANMGGGQAFYATDLSQLDRALDQMIESMVAKPALFTASPSIERDGLYSGNFVYLPAFRSRAHGRWSGTVKKYCLEPGRSSSGGYDTADRRCLFASNDGRGLVTNPNARDLWTNTATTAADQGGAGLLLLSRLGPALGAPRTPTHPRRLLTWRPDQAGYVDVTASAWSADDAFASGLTRHKLINHLHGYTFDARADGAPVAVASWPYGDAIHMPTALLRYGTNCQIAGQCFVVVGANDGQLHVHDTANGDELSALIPAELWRPTGVAAALLSAVDDQPSVNATHHYYLDGGLSLFHDDTNGDGLIQPNEVAHLVFGLGRGGAAYYQVPVSTFNGVFDGNRNPVRALVGLPTAGIPHLADAWATPWLGAPKMGDRARRLAVFPSGHLRALDQATTPMTDTLTPRARLGAATTQACATALASISLPTSLCGNYSATSYYADPSATDTTLGPITVANAAAYRLTFSQADIDPNDRLLLVDASGQTIATLSGATAVPWVSPWIYSPAFHLRWVTDGRATSHRGFSIASVESLPLTSAAPTRHYPGVYAVDLDRWNGAAPADFAAANTAGAVVLEISAECTTNPEICVDASANADLADLRCPISTDVSVLTTGDRLTALYWGDECGQLWKAWPTDRAQTTWRARRLLRLNETASALLGHASKDYRKVFRRVDLVPSTCPGQRVTGVYFGTGNVQRPTAVDDLGDPALAPGGRDVVGVVWDSDELPTGIGLSSLSDVTHVVETDPRVTGSGRRYGWYWSLGANERMLRDPLVFDGVAYFKTFRPASTAAECSAATGADTIYAVDNCTAHPRLEGPTPGYQVEDRAVWSGTTDVGGNLSLITTRTGQPIVTPVNLSRSERAQVLPDEPSRVPRIFHWREPRRN